MDDMIVKSKEQTRHTTHLQAIFKEVIKHGTPLNPDKYTFDVRSEKFAGCYLTERRIEVNLVKC